jgi:hypothetical protein
VTINRFIHAVELVNGVPAPKTMCGQSFTDVRPDDAFAESGLAEKHGACHDAVILNLAYGD